MNIVQTKASQREILEAELERLKRLTGLGLGLEVVWAPGADKALLGEVKGKDIYIYEECMERALETLRHEFLDYCISRAIEPYKEVTNRLISMINRDAYRRKEEIVEALTKLLKNM